jgi:hypothetical protein
MRHAIAIVLGLVTTVALSLTGQLALSSVLAAPDGSALPLGRTFLSATLALAFAASVAGGFVAAHAAPSHRMRAALGVALGVLALGIVATHDAPPGAPRVIVWALPALAWVGALGGGVVRATVRGATAEAKDRA